MSRPRARLASRARWHDDGFSLIEALVAIAILGIVLAALVPAFVGNLRTNTRSEIRGGAVRAAQQVLESLRAAGCFQPIECDSTQTYLPTGGTLGPEIVRAGGRDFSVVTRLCPNDAYCSENTRFLRVEVSLDERIVYTADTVYSQL